MKNNSSRVALIGAGGCGMNILNTVLEYHPNFVASLAVNRDEKSIEGSAATEKVYLKADSASQIDHAVKQSRSIICQFLKGKNALILFAGMGGFSGTYASPLIAGFAKELHLPTLAFITLPFSFEGKGRMECALKGENHLIDAGATVMTYSNQNLIRNVPANTSMLDAFRIVDQKILKLIESRLFSSSH